MKFLSSLGNWLAPPPKQSDDGRDQWPSRASFVLACMGGCAGMGNLLRYPSQVYNNYGLQWFIPYLIAIFMIAIPILVLEIAIGQAYRGGAVTAYNAMNYRLKGTGLGLMFVGFFVGHYFVLILAWIMIFFRHSFSSPLPWEGRGNEFWNEVVANPTPIQNGFYLTYPGTALIGETVGWTAFTWFLVWLCIFRGVGLTGRVVYFTMGLPFAITIILVGRSLSLENAGQGVRLMWATWRGDQLATGQLWQTAVGQVFFSTGVGFGYFTSYASYNARLSNAVMDSFIICCSNIFFENFAALQSLALLGFFVCGQTKAIVQMPAAQFWAVMSFFTLMVLGFSSSFAMLDAIVTLVMDTGIKVSRPIVVTALVVFSFLLSLPYCTEFGYYLLDGVDRWINEVALIFVVWSECVSSNVVYRYKDVTDQVGVTAFVIYNVGYLGGMIFGPAMAHAVSPAAGAGAGFGFYVACLAISVLVAETPTSPVVLLRRRSCFTTRFWYLAFYSGEQLRRDLNVVVGAGKNWKIPPFWPILVRYISAPILAIIYSFSYSAFYSLRRDPMHIAGFTLAHFCLVIVSVGFILPRWYDVFIPPHRRHDGNLETVANESIPAIECRPVTVDKAMEEGSRAKNGADTSSELSTDGM